MEELKQKFAKQVAFIDKMRENIIINSNNFEILKNLTHSINEKVLVLEKAFVKNEYLRHNEKIGKAFEEIKNDKVQLNNFWSERFIALEEKTEADKIELHEDIEQKKFETEVVRHQEQLQLKELLEVNKRKIEQVEERLETQKKFIKTNTISIKCEECRQIFKTRADLKSHVRSSHPKHITCNQCELSFTESWQLEMHLKTHNAVKEFKCDECGKEFYLKWRFSQHIKTHKCPKVKHCHYFNNNKVCPYEEVGCKFKHTKSSQCRNKNNCKTKLCAFQHSIV